ncbi:MAG: hypothetical protein A3K66_06485 [Euryarchaeota archaeon RBG_16_67_27]|nr:MAG: hypothetical protein A3K66_06485 [Euryarchaeota archaeon RBG_16_67_27]
MLTLAPLASTQAHEYWRVYIDGRTDLPSRSVSEHVERYLRLPEEEQKSHFAFMEAGRIVGTARLLPGTLAGFSIASDRQDIAPQAIVKALDTLRAQGAASVIAYFDDSYERTFADLGFRRQFARMRMEAPTGRRPRPDGIDLRPPEEPEVAKLTRFLMDVYEGHLEQAFGMHVGSEGEWREYVIGTMKGTEAGRFLPDASFVVVDGDRLVGAILLTHWMGVPLVSELGVARDRRRRGLGRALLRAGIDRLGQVGEPRIALYTTVGNDPAVGLYESEGFAPAGGQTVTAKLAG